MRNWSFSEVVTFLKKIGSGIENYQEKIVKGGLLNHAAKEKLRSRYGITSYTADEIINKYIKGVQND